jgi:uncharacterized protein YndB with AHSA1/START domain
VIEFTIEETIGRPPSEVFAFVTDPAQLPRWQTNTVSADPEPEGPLRVGSRLREVHRGPGGRELQSVAEVVELEPERRFSLDMLEGPLPLDARLCFEPAPGGTRFAFTVRGELSGPFRLAQPLLRRTLEREFGRHCAALKRVLESGA